MSKSERVMTNPSSIFTFTALLLSSAVLFAQTATQFESARHRMVDEVVAGAGVKNPRVLQAIRDTPRHEFVAMNLRKQAYFDMALPIGFQQTISSPFIVAYMTESLDPQPTDKVLEIGTGSGYQAAVLSPLVKEVYSIEIVEGLGRKAERTLKQLRYTNVFTKVGDGFKGWPEHAPFNKIIVTCSPEGPPQPLIDQLAEGGLMVIPAGQRYQQTLYLMRKKNGKLEKEALRPTLFVPMTGTAEDLRRVKPDPSNPQAANGNFEEAVGENGFIPGWYYQRQAEITTDRLAPEGEHFVTFKNEEAGRSSHLLQGLPIDGREVAEIELSAVVKHTNVFVNLGEDALPSVGITFYDENRNDLGHNWIGPFRGSADWSRVKKRIRVPIQAREGLLRLGLFGATGELSFDSVIIEPISR
ncbi:MAG: protein-L-isoaspartate(D-aspartate) O-methyltransferase [Planctomycetales bacterium]|nr:protein-L-isoaspartate(D-aspartate) O-methyltransferase [Planctomycetales bacterium]